MNSAKRRAAKNFYLYLIFIVSVFLVSTYAISTGDETTAPVQADTIESTQSDIVTEFHSEGELSKDEKIEMERKAPGLIDFLLSGKYISFFILMVAGLILLMGGWINIWIRILLMLVAFVLFGIGLDFLFPLHPSPMCAVTKLFMFKFTLGKFFPAFIAMFLAIFIPSLIGRKLFCGWVCPLGALQELINKIPHKLKFKQFSFTSFNAIRMALLAMFFITFFYFKDMMAGLAQNENVYIDGPILKAYSAYSIYEPINFFELLHWNITATFAVMLVVLIIASFVLYRPFCYSICPIGALTWIFEKIAPGKVRVDHDKCNDCDICIDESPCPTIAKIKDSESKSIPDCTSCGECLKTCPEDAIYFGFKKR